MKCEHEKGCENCNNNAFAIKPDMQKCLGCVSPEYKNFESAEYEKENKIMKCWHERFCGNCNRANCKECEYNLYAGFQCKLCNSESMTNKGALTIPELKGMDGLPVWVTEIPNKGWHLVDAQREIFTDNRGNQIGFKCLKRTEVFAYKEKPSPRMVTIETAIEGKLKIRYLITDEFKPALECLQFTVNRYGLPDESWVVACWEVKEG